LFFGFISVGKIAVTVTVTDRQIAEWADALHGASPAEVLAWAAAEFAPRIGFATGLGAEGCVLIHHIATAALPIDVFTIDTGVLFPETVELHHRLEQAYGVVIRRVKPALSLDAQSERYGPALWERDPDQCCALRKVQPLDAERAYLDAWISAIRRDQTHVRAAAGVVERDRASGLVKVNPLVGWTHAQVWAFIRTHGVPYHSLHDRGYPSIGCEPCTTPVAEGEDPRAGRWRGREKTECGLHLDRSVLPLAFYSSRPEGA
jgi:phosphoadenylyl-sulfate reductase (thioredoxin)